LLAKSLVSWTRYWQVSDGSAETGVSKYLLSVLLENDGAMESWWAAYGCGFKRSGRGGEVLVSVLYEKASYLERARQFASAYEALIEHVFQHFQQNAGLNAVQ